MASPSRRIYLGLLACLVLMAVLMGRAAAQLSSCTQPIMNLSPCLNYVMGNSSNPSSSCCSQLSIVVQSSPQCLCSVLSGSGMSSLGFTINQTLALSLPGACKVTTPPVSQCQASNAPAASTNPPASAPAESQSPNDTPEAALTPISESDVPLGGGSKSVPSTDGSLFDGSIVKAPLRFVLILLLALSCSSTFTTF